MKFAAFEAATEWCSVALWLDGEVVGIDEMAGNRHSERMLPLLEKLFKMKGIAARDLDAVAFGAGPGSFTGLRIACGVAQGIAFARGIPAIGIPTLETLAEECGAPRVVACLDARMGEVYYSALERNDAEPGRRWIDVIPALCVTPGAAPRPPGEGWIGCGSGFAAYGSLGFAKVNPEIHPSAVSVANLAAPRLAAGEGVDAARALPVYVRDKVALTEAERAAQ
jgi:tRNA threonylcarbamoyladenosine biosynthesis protein TsaB